MGAIGDLSAVGNAATVSKKSTSQPQDLTSFEVKKGGDGGVLVCENYERKTPAGRRAGSYPGGKDYQEHPFSADEGAAAAARVGELMAQMGVAVAEAPAEEPPPMAAPPMDAAAMPVPEGDEGY